MGAAGVGSFALGVPTSTAAATNCGIPEDETGNYDEENIEWSIDNGDDFSKTVQEGTQLMDYTCRVAGTLKYLGATYGPDNRWNHYFRAGAIGTAEKKKHSEPDDAYEKTENVSTQAIHVENRDTSYAELIFLNSPHWLGGYPPQSGSEDGDFSDAAFTVATSLLSLHPKLAIPATGLSIINALQTASGGFSDPNIGGGAWMYSDEPCECTSFVQFELKSLPGESKAHVETENFVEQSTGFGYSNVNFWNVVDADPGGGSGCSDGPCPESTNPQPGDEEYIEYLQTSDVAERISSTDAHSSFGIESNSEPVYKATKPAVFGDIGKTPADFRET